MPNTPQTKRIDGFIGRYSWLSNDSSHPIQMKAREGDEVLSAPTAAHAFEILRTNDAQSCLALSSGAELRRYTKTMPDSPGWNEQVAVNSMVSVLLAKFNPEVNPELTKRLLATGNAILINRNQHGDTFWGINGAHGKNLLGQILMRLREKLREDESKATPESK